MHLEHVEPCCERAQRCLFPAILNLANLIHGELVWREPAAVHRNRAGRDHRPDVFAACAVAFVDRSVAVPGALHGRLAACVRELHCRHATLRFDEIGDALQWRDVGV